MRRNMAGHRVIAPRKDMRVYKSEGFGSKGQARKVANWKRQEASGKGLMRIFEARRNPHDGRYYVYGYTVK